ncbi:MAG: M23 family metallopeptidase [Propionibacteriales bacterium]|nr:M23 family metallopeptidase [Propionibacteriales bacterium]
MGNHRAERDDPTWVSVATTPVGGARAAGRRRATRRDLAAKPFRRIPAVPTIVGAFAIAAAASGAVTMGPGESVSDASPVSFSGADAFSYSSSEGLRAQAISRDTARQALEDKVDQELTAEVAARNQVRNDAMAALAASAEKRADQIAKNLWVVPTENYHLTARFGQSSGLWSHYHTGLDFAAPSGTPIFAVANGVITFTGYDGAYGNKTIQTLPDGTEIWYCHQSAIGVSVGDTVIQGKQIGNVGSTGNVTGPHVHIEVRPGGGDPIDPYSSFLYHGVTP